MSEPQQRQIQRTSGDQTAPTSAIEKRIDKSLAGSIQLNTDGGLLVKDIGQAMEVAKLMSISGTAVPLHIRNNPGTCLAVAIQAWEWSMNPFAVANKSYVVNDRLAYESALYNAVATRRAPIVGRLRIAYSGEGETRRCTVSATITEEEGGGEVDYQSPLFKTINPKNSPLWKNDPDQQLFYFSVRAFVRRHFPDVMMGVFTVDELQDSPEMSRPKPERAEIEVDKVLGRATETTSAPGGTAEEAPKPRPAAKRPEKRAESAQAVESSAPESEPDEERIPFGNEPVNEEPDPLAGADDPIASSPASKALAARLAAEAQEAPLPQPEEELFDEPARPGKRKK